MKVLFVLSALVAVALAKPGVLAPAGVTPLAYNAGYAGYAGYPFYNHLGYSGLGYNYNYAGAPALTSYAAPVPAISYAGAPALSYAAAPAISYAVPSAVKTQYHAQDELGQASYGYAHPGQQHDAVRDAFGNVAGSYSYVDPNGKIVKTDYIADAGGFRVASNALPVAPAVPVAPEVVLPVGPAPVQDTVEVVAARAAHLAEHAAAKSRSKRGVLAYSSPIAHGYNYATAAYPYASYPYADNTYAYAAPAYAYGARAYSYGSPAYVY